VNGRHPGLLALLVETCLVLQDVPSAEHAARQLLDAAPEHPRATEVMCVATQCCLCSACVLRAPPLTWPTVAICQRRSGEAAEARAPS
jgi:hypothetical protein